MKTIDSQIFMELFNSSIEECLSSGNIELTEKIASDEVFLIHTDNSPICFVIGWDTREIHNVISMN